VPSLSGFKQRFLDGIRVKRADHPETIQFYESKYSGLLRYPPSRRHVLIESTKN